MGCDRGGSVTNRDVPGKGGKPVRGVRCRRKRVVFTGTISKTGNTETYIMSQQYPSPKWRDK